MQNNVEKERLTLIALAVALAVFLLLAGAFILMLEPREEYIYVSEASGYSSLPSETRDGVSYLGTELSVTEYTKTVRRGEKARISVLAQAETDVWISVYYESGKSSSKVFVPKTASPEQHAEWEWTVPSGSTSEKVRVVLRSDNCYATFDIELT